MPVYAATVTQGCSGAEMTAGQYLFGFDGRINRAKWWLLVLVQIGAAIVFNVAAMSLVGASMMSAMSGGSVSSAGGSVLLMILLSLVYVVLMFIVWLAVTIKRLHDRDKSGVWILLFAVGPWACLLLGAGLSFGRAGSLGGLFMLAGLAVSVWAFVELGCLRGTIGSNRFGPDPLAFMQYSSAPPPPVQSA
jgi:uncharacterized membrane protein YhaH (DUF805 family)